MFPLFEPLELLSHAKPRYPRQLYVVRPGDTLEAIADHYDMKVIEVRAINEIWQGEVHSGQEIQVQRKMRARSLPLLDDKHANREKEVVFKKPPLPSVFSLNIRFTSNDLGPSNEKSSLKIRGRSRSAHVPSAVEAVCRAFDMPNLVGAKTDEILSEKRYAGVLMPKIMVHLPYSCRAYDWELLYSNSQHGSSLETLLRRARKKSPSLVLMETSVGEVFGGFVTTPWAPSTKYVGTGESFVFTCIPHFAVYDWKRTNTLFMRASESGIGMGGGGSFAWNLNDDLLRGTTGRSETYGNRCLASEESFELANVEVWGFSLRW